MVNFDAHSVLFAPLQETILSDYREESSYPMRDDTTQNESSLFSPQNMIQGGEQDLFSKTDGLFSKTDGLFSTSGHDVHMMFTNDFIKDAPNLFNPPDSLVKDPAVHSMGAVNTPDSGGEMILGTMDDDLFATAGPLTSIKSEEGSLSGGSAYGPQEAGEDNNGGYQHPGLPKDPASLGPASTSGDNF